jgi:hypothetical protein
MSFNPAKLTTYGLFKQFWTTPEGTNDGLAHRALDEVTPLGAQTLESYAKTHELDGTESTSGQQKIDDDEKALMKAILEHEFYGTFFEADARPLVMQKFGIAEDAVHAPATAKHPVDVGSVEIPASVSKHSASQLANVDPERLPEIMSQEYASRKSYFDSTSISADERGKRALGLLKSYADALWSHGETERTEMIGHAMLDAFEQMKYSGSIGSKDYNGAGWSAAQSLVLGLDPNSFENKFPKAFPTAETTYLAMNDQMAKPMKFVDDYREAKGQGRKAEEFELKSPLGWVLGEESGHTKRGNLDESKPFSTSGLNWGTLLFPNDSEVKNLPPKKGFEFPIDCIDGLNSAVQAKAAWGDRIEVVDDKGKKLKVEKKIEKDASGKAVSWYAEFKDSSGKTVEPSKVLGLIKSSSGQVKGDGKASRSLDMWWWGFCDRNTAQRLYKSAYGIPQLDRENIKVKVGDKTITVPKAEAQKLIDCDIPDLVTGESYSGFRFNDEPQEIRLKNGQRLTGKVRDLALEAGPGVTRIESDLIAIHDSPKRPMLGNIEVKTDSGSELVDVRNIDTITQDADGKVTVKAKQGWPETVTGELLTKVPWDKAETVGGKKVLKQTEDHVIRGGFTIDLEDGSTKRVTASEVSQIAGETQKDMRLSQYMTWVSQQKGMYATDGSQGVVVSNGMRWVNKIDVREETGDARPSWAPQEGELTGIQGPLKRQAGDKILWVKGLYAYNQDSDPTSTNFAGWVQVAKNGRIVNEGFTSGQPDFGWGATGKLNWLAKSSFNPYYPPEMRVALFVNGMKDQQKLEELAEKLNLPSNWKSYLTPQG